MKLYEYIKQYNGDILYRDVFVAGFKISKNKTELTVTIPQKVCIMPRKTLPAKIERALESTVHTNDDRVEAIRKTLAKFNNEQLMAYKSDDGVRIFEHTDKPIIAAKCIEFMKYTRFGTVAKQYVGTSIRIRYLNGNTTTCKNRIDLFNTYEDACIAFCRQILTIECLCNDYQYALDPTIRKRWLNAVNAYKKQYQQYFKTSHKPS